MNAPTQEWKPAERLTPKQREGLKLLCSASRHAMLYGGSRSGKTFLICRVIALRAIKAPGSRHLMARFRFKHIKASIWHDTWPKMMRLCFPDVDYTPQRADFYYAFDNGSEVWLGGLDDKERTDKILGNEYSTIFLNECSEINFPTVEKVKTRLAQVVKCEDGTTLKQRLFFDENPPLQTHWSHRLFKEHRFPEAPFDPLKDPENYVSLRINPKDNAANLDPEFLESLERLSPRQRKRFWAGEFGTATENALWTAELIQRGRVNVAPEDMVRVVIAVDPSGTKGPEEDDRSDAVGIIVVGLGRDGLAYVLEDLTMKARPSVWGRAVVSAYQRHFADIVVGEINFGGAMVEDVIRSAARELRIGVKFKEVTASRGKVLRAEPISTLYGDPETGADIRVRHVGEFPELEDQLCAFTTHAYMGSGSPDRADALVFGLSELFPGMTRRRDLKPPTLQGSDKYNPQRMTQRG